MRSEDGGARAAARGERATVPAGGGAAPILLAGLAGAAWGSCFGKEALLLAPWAALAPLILLLGCRRPVLAGLTHGVAAWLVAVPWIVPTLSRYGELAGSLSALLLVVLAVYLALFHAAFAGLGALLWRRGGGVSLVGLPALWVALEWLRAHALGGFPWNLAAYAVTDVPGALPLAAWVGAWGISFLVVAVGTGVALGVRRRRWEPAAVAALGALALLAAGARWGAGREAGRGSAEPLPVRILQPATPILLGDGEEAMARQYAEVLDQAGSACRQPGPLLLFPESATWPYILGRDAGLDADIAALTGAGCPVLLNSAHEEGGRWFNSAFLVDADRPAGRYDKRHLVPFGEYVPFGLDRLPFVGMLARNAGAFAAGGEPALLEWRGERLGLAICFEVIFPGEVAALVRAGATVLVSLTNDAWYGDSSAPRQHLRAARFRAAENRRPLLRAALTGISAVVTADGSLSEELGVGAKGVIAAEVAPRRDRSPFGRAPWLVPLACACLAACTIVANFRRGARPPTGSRGAGHRTGRTSR